MPLVKMKASTVRDLKETIRKVRGMRGPGITNTPAGITIAQPQVPNRPIPRPVKPFAIVKVTSFTSPSALGGAKYWGRKQRRKAGTSFAADATNFNFATFYEDESTTDVLFVNSIEHNSATHDLSLGGYHVAFEVDPTADGVRVFLSLGLSFSC